jgi:hypothetical protein
MIGCATHAHARCYGQPVLGETIRLVISYIIPDFALFIAYHFHLAIFVHVYPAPGTARSLSPNSSTCYPGCAYAALIPVSSCTFVVTLTSEIPLLDKACLL